MASIEMNKTGNGKFNGVVPAILAQTDASASEDDERPSLSIKDEKLFRTRDSSSFRRYEKSRGNNGSSAAGRLVSVNGSKPMPYANSPRTGLPYASGSIPLSPPHASILSTSSARPLSAAGGKPRSTKKHVSFRDGATTEDDKGTKPRTALFDAYDPSDDEDDDDDDDGSASSRDEGSSLKGGAGAGGAAGVRRKRRRRTNPNGSTSPSSTGGGAGGSSSATDKDKKAPNADEPDRSCRESCSECSVM